MRTPGERRLLGDLEPEPARDEEDGRARAAAPKDGADGLVGRVVTADVLARDDERPVRLEEARPRGGRPSRRTRTAARGGRREAT